MSLMILFYPKEDTLKIWGYLVEIEGSWLETRITGASVMSLIFLFYYKEDILKIVCSYLNYKCVYGFQ